MNRSIGEYRIVSLLGSGGMAEVFLAEQPEPLRREVAIKVLRSGLDGRQVLERFEAERQVLARLEHPSIAKVFDAGTTAEGLPYFVMEYVRGLPITQYCDERALGLQARLRVFMQVCGAVQHAHQRGVIHRDLKPANILVEDLDGAGVPKVIDFGIAKIAGVEGRDRTQLTRVGQFIGTPQYMSPEQATQADVEIDTRSDVYSLGAVLYELLTGSVPIPLESVADYAVGIALREREPAPPSRCARPEAPRELRGDLDRIVLKAIAKRREDRYPTANALATDIDLHLRKLPILARPPSVGYVVGRFVRRNRVIVAAGALVLVALVGGLAAATSGLLRARDAERRALTEAASSRELATFLIDLFEVSDPGEARGNTITAREMLDRAAMQIGDTLEAAPETRARMMSTIAEVYGKLGLYAQALQFAQSALAAREQLAETNPSREAALDVAASLDQVGDIHSLLSTPDDALEAHGRALEIQRGLPDADPASLAMTLQRIGVAHYVDGRFTDALGFFEQARAALIAMPDPPKAQHGWLLKYIANQHHEMGDFRAAIPRYREALALIRAAHGTDHPDFAAASGDLAVALKDAGQRAEAEPAYRQALEVFRKTLGSRHPDVANVLSNLAIFYMDGEDFQSAAAHAQEATQIYREVLGDDHRQTNIARLNAARAQVMLGNLPLAESEFRTVLEVRRRTLDPTNASIGITLDALADALNAQRRYTEAERYVREALEIYRSSVGTTHWRYAGSQRTLGASLTGQQRFADAETVLLESYEGLRKSRGDDNRTTLLARTRLAELYDAWGRPDQAAQYR